MKEIRIHGRGGQGSVVTAELLAIGAFKEGLYSQAFPYLGGGGDRRGAPVQAYCRIDDKPIRLKCQIQKPNYLIIQDPSVMEVVDIFDGLQKGSLILLNSPSSPEELGITTKDFKAFSFPATEVALEILKRPIMNTAMIGAFAAFAGGFKLENLREAIKSKFPNKIGEQNAEAMERAFELAKDRLAGGVES